jgi:Domain of unknown function (DUF1735)
MNIKLIKRVSFIITAALVLISFDSCIKNHVAQETVFSNLQDHVLLLNGGLGGVSKSNIGFTTDTATVTITANLASVNPPSGPVAVTIGVDAAQIATYNAANTTSFVILPDSAYTLTTTKLTIPSGQQFASTSISFYKSKLDPSLSYMLPISIKDASGKALTSNENTLFFNIIGNPIAGNYSENWRRWNQGDTTGAPTYNFTDPNVFSAESPTQVGVTSVENGAQFHISFTNTANVLSNFQVALDPASYAAFGAATITTQPVILIADPVKGIYSFLFQYVNTGAANRSIIQTFTKQ